MVLREEGAECILAATQGRSTKPRKKAAAAEALNGAAGFLGMVPPVPHGNALAFPEFAAALKARLQADAAEGSAAHGRRRALATHEEDEAAHDAGLGADDDGVQDGPSHALQTHASCPWTSVCPSRHNCYLPSGPS
jgi:hypothetical protein